MGYTPEPVDLSHVKLSYQLEQDIEIIAKDIHETWAVTKSHGGWVYGEKTDEIMKTHPSMVEYEKLSESEKDVDRATVTQTIKMLLWLGYRIEKEEQSSAV